MDFLDRLDRARTGGAILFCGAGFSADALAIEYDETIGASGALLKLMNEQLVAAGEIGNRRSLQNASQAIMNATRLGAGALRKMLQEKYQVGPLTEAMVDIVRYPWDRIYTTNYDLAAEHALREASKRYRTLNNTDLPEDRIGNETQVIHLHGCAQRWDAANFNNSCVLSRESYENAPDMLRQWLAELRKDFDRSSIFVFVGFSMADAHLEHAIRNVTAGREKVFFVNQVAANPDPDMADDQSRAGTPLWIGTKGLAKHIRDLPQTAPNSPHLPSFLRYDRPAAATATPSVDDIRSQLIFGFRVEHRAQILRDLSLDKPQFQMRRRLSAEIMNRIENGENQFLVTGEICDGKSLIMEQIAAALSLTRPVLFLQYALMSTTQEVLRLLHTSPNAVVIIENCFDFRPESLNEIMTAFADKTAVLLMTARSLSARAEASEAEKMKQNKALHHIRIPRLDEGEALQLIRYTDMIGNWTKRPMSPSEKLRYVMQDCKASLPTFLMEFLNSEVVRDAYKMEFNRVASSASGDALRVLVATFYLSHIGHVPTAQELSNLLELDAARCIRSLDGSNNQLELLREVRGEIHTVPSIGARNILRQIVPTQYPALVVDTVVQMLHALSDHSYYRSDRDQYIFKQLMRYSVLQRVVENKSEWKRFFDEVKNIDACRNQVLFWVQFHMVTVDLAKEGMASFVTAEDYLKQAYTLAQREEQKRGHFDRSHLDHRRSMFLMSYGMTLPWQAQRFRDFNEAVQITARLLQAPRKSHYPYATLIEHMTFIDHHLSNMSEAEKIVCLTAIANLGRQAHRHIDALEEGHPLTTGRRALEQLEAFQKRHQLA